MKKASASVSHRYNDDKLCIEQELVFHERNSRRTSRNNNTTQKMLGVNIFSIQ